MPSSTRLLAIPLLLLVLGACGDAEPSPAGFEVGPGGYLCEVEVVDGLTGEAVPHAEVFCSRSFDWSAERGTQISMVEMMRDWGWHGARSDAEGRLRVRLKATDSTVAAWAEGRLGSALPDPVDPTRCRVEVWEDFALAGQVLDSGGRPFPDAEVWLTAAAAHGRMREFVEAESYSLGLAGVGAFGRFRVPHVSRVLRSGVLGTVHHDAAGRPLLRWRIQALGKAWSLPATFDEPAVFEVPDTGLLRLRLRSVTGEILEPPDSIHWAVDLAETSTIDSFSSLAGLFEPLQPSLPGVCEAIVPRGASVDVEMFAMPFLGTQKATFPGPVEPGARQVVDWELDAEPFRVEAAFVDERGLPLRRATVVLGFAEGVLGRTRILGPPEARLRMEELLGAGQEPPRLKKIHVAAAGYRETTFEVDRLLTPGFHDLGAFRLERAPAEPEIHPAEARRAEVQVLVPSADVLRWGHLRVAARPPAGEYLPWSGRLEPDSPGLARAELACPEGPFDLVVLDGGTELFKVGRFELGPGESLSLRGSEALDLRDAWRSLWLTAVDLQGEQVPWRGMWFDLEGRGLGHSIPEVPISGRRVYVPKTVGRLAIGLPTKPAVLVDADATRVEVVHAFPVQGEIRADLAGLPPGVRPVIGYRVLRDRWEVPLDDPIRWQLGCTEWRIERTVVGSVLRGEFHPATELEVTVSLERGERDEAQRIAVETQRVVVEAGDGSDVWRHVLAPGRDSVARALEQLGR